MRIISKEQISQPFKGELGELIYEMIGKPNNIGGTIHHSFVHVIIPPKKSSSKHYHKVSEETYYILNGLGKIIIDDQEFILKPGQACLIMPGEVHQIFNNEDADLEFLTISAPARDPSDTYQVK